MAARPDLVTPRDKYLRPNSIIERKDPLAGLMDDLTGKYSMAIIKVDKKFGVSQMPYKIRGMIHFTISRKYHEAI